MLRRRFLFAKVYEEKPVYKYTYTTTDGYMLSGLAGVKNHKYENGVGSFETHNKSCINFIDQSTLESIIIPNGVIIIGENAFYYCSGLTSVTIPNSVTKIGNAAFYGCSDLEKVCINDIEAWCSIDFSSGSANPLGYAHNLYLNGELVTDLVIPTNVTNIRYCAFYKCTSLTSVVIGNSVTTIETNAFSGCSSLTNVTIGNSVTSIGSDAFYGCEGLTSIEIHNSVTSIGNCAFGKCTQLTEIYSLNPTPPVITSYVFQNIGTNGVLKIPKGSDYSSWMQTSSYYLGYYNWTVEEIETL